MTKRLCGIIPPMVTPLLDRDTLDVAGLERLIEHMLAGGVHGLFVLGTTGEAPSLSYRLRREVIDRSVRIVAGRVPVLVGITDSSLVESLAIARHSADAGAFAAVAAPPFYFPAGQPELLHYIEHLTAELPLPLYLYNMPMMTKITFGIHTVESLLSNGRIIGVKDSGGDLGYFEQLLDVARGRPDWSVLVGPENMLADSVLRGGHGGVNGGANLHPRLYVELYNAACRRDGPRIAQLWAELYKLGRIYRVGRHASSVIKGLKCALSLRGICGDFMAEPFHKFEAPERARVEQLLDEVAWDI